jgi:bacterioferritin
MKKRMGGFAALATALLLAASLAGLPAAEPIEGHPDVLAALAGLLKDELTAINQYMVHAEMCEHWGYPKLAAPTEKRAITEMRHAEKLIGRILYLEGKPRLDVPIRLRIGETVQQQLENDLALEREAIAAYNRAIEICRQNGDLATARLLAEILADEDDHNDFLETQLSLIRQLGLENYMTLIAEPAP